jgi:aspartate aminotransferase
MLALERAANSEEKGDHMVSERVKILEKSMTLAITSKAKAMKAKGEPVIILASGEPDFDTPDNIKEAAKKALDAGFTKYVATAGIEELRELICQKFKKDNHIDYKKSQIVVTVGGKQAIYNAVLAVVNPGDEVIVPVPYWVSYLEQVKLAGGKTVLLSPVNGKFNMEGLKKSITERTRMIILNSPNNPTGEILNRETLRAIADLAVQKKIYVLSDEVYEKLIYDGAVHHSIASFDEAIRELTITVNAFSKSYSMTGWRVGYCGGNDEVINAMCSIQDHSTSNTCSISQKAAVEALKGTQEPLGKMVEEFNKRRLYMVERLNAMPGIACPTPPGAFYAWARVSGLYNTAVKGSLDFAARLLDEKKVAIIPGIGFGDDECVRLSYASSMNDIKEGMDRLEDYAKELAVVKKS